MSILFFIFSFSIFHFTLYHTSRHYGDCKVQCNSIYVETICLYYIGIDLMEFCQPFVYCISLLSVTLPMNRTKPIGHPNTNKTFWLQIGPQSKTKLNDEFRFNPFSGFQLLKCLFFIRIIFHLFFLFFFWNL